MKKGKSYGEVQVNMSGGQVSAPKNHDIPKDKGKASVKEGEVSVQEKAKQVEEEALEAIYLGKENITEDVMSWEDGGRHMGEADILGINPIKGSTVNEEALKEDGLTVEDK
ncbi:hypothetical protein V6N11_077843 [Hibiscus sabdariffa]|uniref:Uncharacterized protein n=1 Tax=Hibiscus sabdariffa TaxID=183260 RepID=A0ABR2TF59_9ROSI